MIIKAQMKIVKKKMSQTFKLKKIIENNHQKIKIKEKINKWKLLQKKKRKEKIQSSKIYENKSY